MEQEPVYVMSDKLRRVCEQALGKIYDYRKTHSQDYVEKRTQAYNLNMVEKNKRRGWFGWLGMKPRDYLTPFGMENMIRNEMVALSEEELPNHPMCQINSAYLDMEHQCKDAMIQCAMNESVLVSSDLARGISHLGIPLDFCKRRPIGFLP